MPDNDPKAYVVYEYDLIDHDSYNRFVYLDLKEAKKQVDQLNGSRRNKDYEYQIEECVLIT